MRSEEDRALMGAWVSEELNRALQLGYRHVEIMEVWHFEECSNTVFIDYMCIFMKIKQ